MKRPTQVDVARRAGVSRATVSYVLNGVTKSKVSISDETRQRVREAAEELGYVPDARARSLRSGRSHTLGLIVPDIQNPHHWEVASGVEQEAREHGYHVLLSGAGTQRARAGTILTDLSQRRIDGLIVPGSLAAASDAAEEALEQSLRRIRKRFRRSLPIVEIASQHEAHPGIDQVVSDYYDATIEAMEHLIRLRHRRIGLLVGVVRPAPAADRLESYRAALLAAGLPVEEALIVRQGPAIADGYAGAMQLLNLPERPTAVVAINDMLAIGALRAIYDAGLRVPEDISLMGYDDIAMAEYLVPRLTTVSKDIAEMGRTAVRLLLARIEDPDRPPRTERYPARLIIRESIAPAPA